MAYGKGPWTAQDKVLPGTYINVVGQAPEGVSIGSRGKAAIALELDWGNDQGDIVKVIAQDFYNDSEKIFGYKATDVKMSVVRQIFMGASELYVYRLNGQDGTKASSVDFATAKYAGARGNDIKVVVSVNVDDTSTFDVATTLDGIIIDRQLKVTAETVQDNDYVTFTKGEDFALVEGTKAFSGGANGAGQTTVKHNDFLTKLIPYQINGVGLVYESAGSDQLAPIYASWVKNQRDVYGNRLQAVLYNTAADHEGIINVDGSIDLVPWVLGKEVGCALDATLQNVVYDGEAPITTNYTQSDLISAIQNGKFVFHRVGDSFRVLADINSLVNLTGDKTEDFKYNQSVRVSDQLALDVENIWVNGYIGKIPNNEDGRVAFWNDIISLLNEYQEMGAIDVYVKDEIVVAPGVQRGSVVTTIPVTIATMLEKAYITIVVQ